MVMFVADIVDIVQLLSPTKNTGDWICPRLQVELGKGQLVVGPLEHESSSF
jgi:hypothetical protein